MPGVKVRCTLRLCYSPMAVPAGWGPTSIVLETTALTHLSYGTMAILFIPGKNGEQPERFFVARAKR